MADANVSTVSMTEKQRVKEITDRLEEGLKELFESEKYKSYLSTMSKFHNYSFNNTLLIALQKPEATLVAGFKAWQTNFNRHVNKGEKGIRILAPAPYKIKEERDKLDPVTGEIMLDKDGMPQTEEVEIKIPAFRAVSVFDISQTDGEPIPEWETKELLSTVEGYEDFIKAVTFVAPVPIRFEDIPGESKGYFNTTENRIAVQEGMSESQTLKTMIHETAHSMLHNKEVNADILAPAKDRNTKEVEAESIAYTVCQHFGIETSEYSFSYIAGWSSGKDMKELKASLDTIRRTASELITGIEGQLQEIQHDREVMQAQEKESLLLVQNSDLSEYSLVNVRGMDAGEIVKALSEMNDNDRLSVAAYLESRGAWTTEIANQDTKEFGEYRIDVYYNTDENEIIDLKAERELREKAKEPIGADDVIVKMVYEDGEQFEIARITNKAPEEVKEVLRDMLERVDAVWDGDVEEYFKDNQVEYIPIIVSNGVNSHTPEFYDYEVNLKTGEIAVSSELSAMQQAEGIINRLEFAKTAFSDDQRNLIVDYAYKLNDMEKTRELAEHIYYEETEGNQGAALAMIDAQAEIDALPDPMIGLLQMQEYGYTGEEMLPLTKETAMEMFDRDMPLYQLYEDGSESFIEDRGQITGHDGIFGIEKSDWENELNLRSMQEELAESSANKEAQLLYGDTDKYGIYQLKDIPELRQFQFAGTESLKSRGIIKDGLDAVKPENYNLIYVGELSELSKDFISLQTREDTLEALYEKFNIDHPKDFKGHSLSVSDIVVLHEDGKNSAHFVESVGYTELPEFIRVMEGEKEPVFTEEEKQFLETDSAPLVAKKFLAWDEIEDLGYRFFEDGYIDKFKPAEKALFSDGLVSDYKIHEIARRMQGGEDVREELAKAFIGDYEGVIGVGEHNAMAVFGRDDMTVTFGNAKKQISYEEMGTAFLGLIESEYKDIAQARAAEEQEEGIAEDAASGHDLKSREQPETEQSEPQAEQREPLDGTSDSDDMDDGDEMIDLGDETEQVLSEMKKSLTGAQEAELAFQIADRYISIQETEGGYDYSIMGMDYKEIDGGVYDNPDISIREALANIVGDLKEYPFGNGARGNIRDNDELMPIDYDGLMEKVDEANRIEPQGGVVADFKAKTNELFHEISKMNPSEIEETVKCHVQAKLEEYGIDAEIVDAAVTGSRCRGLEQEGSDLDVVVELSTNEREDFLFNTFNENGLHIGGVRVDINPITAQGTGTLETYLPQAEAYLAGVREKAAYSKSSLDSVQTCRWENEPAPLSQEQTRAEVTLTVAECSEFHDLGEFYENIPTVEEAVAIWKQIPPERMNGIPAIGIHIHTLGTETIEDVGIDVLIGKRIELDILDYVPDIKGNPQAMETIAELMAKLPEIEVDGSISEEMEAMVWEKRMPDLTSAEQLAVELDRFIFEYDAAIYHDNISNMTENVSDIADSIDKGDISHLTEWITDMIAEGMEPEETKRAAELLEKLTEYKPLAKIEEMEEQNYNMVDNMLNNGAGEKAQKEENKREQECPAERFSLKARLAEKKALVSGQGKDHEAQENIKNSQREM